jgi:TolB protein
VGKKNLPSPFALLCAFALVCALPDYSHAQNAANPVGIFETHADVGVVLHPGSTNFDAGKGAYTISGSGENMWAIADAYQFAWKKISGDVMLTADIALVGTGGNEHRKAVLMMRQSLDADSPYVDIARHGNGMTSLQYRMDRGGITREVIATTADPKRLRIVRRGDHVYMLLGEGDNLQVAGGWIRFPLQGPLYVGIGVCSHNKDVSETAIFSNVELTTPPAPAATPILYSSLETVKLAATTDRTVVYLTPGRIEAPNWTHDGTSLLFNRNGHIERLPAAGGTPEVLDTGFATNLNNDHGISPDGTQLAISDSSQQSYHSFVYILPIAGGTPRRITENSPSYWHSWSPDGKTLAFAGQRNGDFDIFTIPVAGGDETRLTSSKGTDDGPEYSPDGKYIYFNSERTGSMQIWRMRPDGSEQQQITADDFNNWFPHISPDGKWMVFLSYEKGVTGHPQNKDVNLRLMSMTDDTSAETPSGQKPPEKIRVIAHLFGGQGTINVPSWSPDSKAFAFVSYQLIP